MPHRLGFFPVVLSALALHQCSCSANSSVSGFCAPQGALVTDNCSERLFVGQKAKRLISREKGKLLSQGGAHLKLEW